VDHSSDRHHNVIMSVATSKHSSDGHDHVIVPIATRKHSSDGFITSSCSLLLCFSYFNELVKSLKIYILSLTLIYMFSNGKFITNVVFLFQSKLI
jgi:hypothetical protein